MIRAFAYLLLAICCCSGGVAAQNQSATPQPLWLERAFALTSSIDSFDRPDVSLAIIQAGIRTDDARLPQWAAALMEQSSGADDCADTKMAAKLATALAAKYPKLSMHLVHRNQACSAALIPYSYGIVQGVLSRCSRACAEDIFAMISRMSDQGVPPYSALAGNLEALAKLDPEQTELAITHALKTFGQRNEHSYREAADYLYFLEKVEDPLRHALVVEGLTALVKATSKLSADGSLVKTAVSVDGRPVQVTDKLELLSNMKSFALKVEPTLAARIAEQWPSVRSEPPRSEPLIASATTDKPLPRSATIAIEVSSARAEAGPAFSLKELRESRYSPTIKSALSASRAEAESDHERAVSFLQEGVTLLRQIDDKRERVLVVGYLVPAAKKLKDAGALKVLIADAFDGAPALLRKDREDNKAPLTQSSLFLVMKKAAVAGLNMGLEEQVMGEVDRLDDPALVALILAALAEATAVPSA